jgi:hypothetical protein
MEKHVMQDIAVLLENYTQFHSALREHYEKRAERILKALVKDAAHESSLRPPRMTELEKIKQDILFLSDCIAKNEEAARLLKLANEDTGHVFLNELHKSDLIKAVKDSIRDSSIIITDLLEKHVPSKN